MKECPHCGARERLGVWLTRRKAEVFDMVERRGKMGLHWTDTPFGRHLLKVHVHHINEILEETDYKIKGVRAGMWSTYKLEKVR